jgi:DNA-binding response OmpR family regulator
MFHPLEGKAAVVMIVEPVTGRRIMLKKGLKQLGFVDAVVLSSVSDAVKYLDSDEKKPDWIITTLQSDQKTNGFTLLSLTTHIESLQKTLISLLVSEEEQKYLPNAFEMGLYSWHEKELSTDELMKGFEDLFETAEAFAWNDCLTSAHYLRNALVENRLFSDMVALELAMMSVFPEQAWLVINLAQALLFDNKPRAAILALNRAKGFTDAAQDAANSMMNKIAKHMETLAAMENTAERLSLTNCMVVDPDKASNNLVSESYNEMGIPEAYCFADGADAWGYLETPEAVMPDVIIMEWRLPGLSGSAFLQRIMNSKYSGVPVIIFTSLLKDTNDKILVKEMGVLEVLDKPCTKTNLKAKIDSVLTEDRRPKEAITLVKRVRSYLREGKLLEGKELFNQINENKNFPNTTKRALAAEVAFHHGQYETASIIGIEALQMGGEDLHVLNLLGKTYMKLRFFEQSLAFFDRAKKMSPNNIQRLCQLAEVKTEMGDHSDAEESISSAAKIDGGSADVKQAKAVVALNKGELKEANEFMADLDSVWGVVAFMNNRAISLVNENDFDGSIDLYKKAIMSFPKKFQNYQAILHYNLALAQIKAGVEKKAFNTLKRISKLKVNPIASKTKSLHVRVKRAVESGKKIELQTSTKSPDGTATVTDDVLEGHSFDKIQEEIVTMEDPAVPMVYGLERGELRCHMIFKSIDGFSDEVVGMLKFVPKLSITGT